MWGSLKRGSNIKARGERENFVHKCAGTTSNEIGSIFLHQRERVIVIHFEIDNKAVLSYLLKMGETKIELMIKLNKKIWHYLLNGNMSITVEYLPLILNTVTDGESRKKLDSSEWLLHPNAINYLNI